MVNGHTHRQIIQRQSDSGGVGAQWRIIRGWCDEHESLSLGDIQAKRQLHQDEVEGVPSTQASMSDDLGVFHDINKTKGVRWG